MKIVEKKLVLFLCQDAISFFGDTVIHKNHVSLYYANYDYNEIYIPEKYILCDDDGEKIYFSIDSVVKEQETIMDVFKRLEEAKKHC